MYLIGLAMTVDAKFVYLQPFNHRDVCHHTHAKRNMEYDHDPLLSFLGAPERERLCCFDILALG